MTEYTENWSSFSTVRINEPFLTAHTALDNCGFRWTQSIEYHTDQSKIPTFESHVLEIEGFAPGFSLKIDTDEVEAHAERSAKELELHIVIRDKSLHQFITVASKPLEHIPDTIDIPNSAIDPLCGARGLEFGLIISPKRGVTHSEGLANNPGHIVAQKFFELSPPRTSTGFPVAFEDPEHFENGISKKAVWYIRWRAMDKISDPKAEAEEILTVTYNKNCSKKLYHIPDHNVAGKLFWGENAIEVFLEIATVVLSLRDLDPPSKNDKGFYPSLFRSVEKITGRNISEVREEFLMSEASAISRLRASLYEFFDTSRAIERANFGG